MGNNLKIILVLLRIRRKVLTLIRMQFLNLTHPLANRKPHFKLCQKQVILALIQTKYKKITLKIVYYHIKVQTIFANYNGTVV